MSKLNYQAAKVKSNSRYKIERNVPISKIYREKDELTESILQMTKGDSIMVPWPRNVKRDNFKFMVNTKCFHAKLATNLIYRTRSIYEDKQFVGVRIWAV